MEKQSGNFLLQALLALSLIIAFMPFFAKKLASRNTNTQMYITTSQLETAQTAAKIYLRENINNLNYETINISGNNFSDTLEPYGLPLGFIPKTVFNQDITLVINNSNENINAYLKISGRKISKMRQRELIRRIGFYATEMEDDILISVPFEKIFSDIVQVNDSKPDDNGFLSDLNLNGFNLNDVGTVYGRNSEFETLQSGTLSVNGIENDNKSRNIITNIISDKAVFQSNGGASALSLTKGTLKANNIYAKTVSTFGNAGSFYATNASVSSFSMGSGSTRFSGPSNWDVKGNLITDNISFYVEQLEISSFINAAGGQDVFLDYASDDTLEYSSNSGIYTETIRAGNITLRDQTSSALSDGETGTLILDIRPSGTSVLPDALITGISNGSFKIISDPYDSDGNTVTCESIITSLNRTYNASSLAQNIICQYVFWNRLEQRINIKQCLLDGGTSCE